MQRIKWVDERLQQWAHWRFASSGGYRSPDFVYRENGYTFGGKITEINADMERQAIDMDQAIASLPSDLSKAVIAYYTWEGGMSTITEKLRVTRATVHRRLCHADVRIADWLDEKAKREVPIKAQSRQISSNFNYATYTN
ncbi:hypothetical protein H0A65_10990 [Alcaligenaceae bacterium]|nr:hypothetical protein [Alcaligenaceae bacterium]